MITHPVEVPLTQGHIAIIDECDAQTVFLFPWQIQKTPRGLYAQAQRGELRLHSYIMQPPPGFEVDHIDWDGLNNRRENLRVVTHQQNQWHAAVRRTNPTGFKGVTSRKHRTEPRFQATIKTPDGVNLRLGLFSDAIEAAHVYDAAARKYFGEYAWLNFPDEVAS